MIGKVLWMSGETAMEATLDDDGYWTCSDPIVEDDLNTDLNCDDYSPADGRRGYRQLHKAALRVGGRVEAPDPPEPTPGMVY